MVTIALKDLMNQPHVLSELTILIYLESQLMIVCFVKSIPITMRKDNRDVNHVETLLIQKKELQLAFVMVLIDLLVKVTIHADAKQDTCLERSMELFKKTNQVMKTVFH